MHFLLLVYALGRTCVIDLHYLLIFVCGCVYFERVSEYINVFVCLQTFLCILIKVIKVHEKLHVYNWLCL